MINCNDLRRELSFGCAPVASMRGDRAFELDIPQSFSDGTAMCCYVLDMGDTVEINDDALTIHHLSSLGLNPWHASRMGTLRDRVSAYGYTLDNAGALCTVVRRDQLAWAVSQFVAAALALDVWAREQRGATDVARNLEAEVAFYLQAWRPSMMLASNPEVVGLSGTPYRFAFLQGSELVDVVQPHPTAVGALMRKLGDVTSAREPEAGRIIVVVEDREDPIHAQREIPALTALASVLPMSRLIQNSKHGHA